MNQELGVLDSTPVEESLKIIKASVSDRGCISISHYDSTKKSHEKFMISVQNIAYFTAIFQLVYN